MQRPSMTSWSTLACSGVTSTAWVSAMVARTASSQPRASTTIATVAPTRIPGGRARRRNADSSFRRRRVRARRAGYRRCGSTARWPRRVHGCRLLPRADGVRAPPTSAGAGDTVRVSGLDERGRDAHACRDRRRGGVHRDCGRVGRAATRAARREMGRRSGVRGAGRVWGEARRARARGVAEPRRRREGSDIDMTNAILVVETVVLVLLTLLVAGLLRSHAEILRRLHALGSGLDPDAPADVPGPVSHPVDLRSPGPSTFA